MPRLRRSLDRRLLFTEAAELLLDIYDAGGENVPLSELVVKSKVGRQSVYKYYRILAEKGLLEVVQETFPGRIYLTLTSRGKEIAEHLKKIEELYETT